MEKLPFQVVHCSSSDDQNPAQRLADHSGQWLSQKFSTFPQTIILRLACGKARIRKLQILGHHSMIPTRMDIYVGNYIPITVSNANATQQPSLLSQIQFNRIGFVTMDDNQKTGFQARELKSVHLDCLGEYVQIVLDKCFINSLNLFNQVGLVAVNLLGEIDETATPHPEPNFMISSTLVVESNEPVQDPAVAKWTRALIKSKERAIIKEDFAMAKLLKGVLETVKTEGDKISKLDIQKRITIEQEDFDQARLFKQEVDTLRSDLEKFLEKQGLFYNTSTNEIIYDNPVQNPAKILPSLVPEELPIKGVSDVNASVPSDSQTSVPQKQDSEKALEQSSSAEKKATEAESQPESEMNATNIPPEDRPIKPMHQAISIEEFDASSLPPGAKPSSSSDEKPKAVKPKTATERPPQQKPSSAAMPISEKPSELIENPVLFTAPRSIPFEDTRPSVEESNFRSTIQLLETPFVRCLHSRDFQAREWAYNYVDDKLVRANDLYRKNSGESEDYRKAIPKNQVENIIRCCYEVIQFGLEDTREKVNTRSLGIWRNLLDFCRNEEINWGLVSKMVDGCIGLLVQKSIDTTRFQKAAYEFIHLLIGLYGTAVHPQFMRPMSNPLLPKFIKSRLSYAAEMLTVSYNTNKFNSLVSLSDFLSFAGSNVDHNSAEVRQVVIEYLVSVYRFFSKTQEREKARNAVCNLCSNAKKGVMDTVLKGINAVDAGAKDLKTEIDYAQGSKRNSVNNNNGSKRNSVVNESPKSKHKNLNENPSPLLQRKNNDMYEDPVSPKGVEKEYNLRSPVANKIDPLSEGMAAIPENGGNQQKASVKATSKIPKPASRIDAIPYANHQMQDNNDEFSNQTHNNPWNIENTCIFCEQSRAEFTEKNLDLHYWKDCPMLTRCLRCQHVVEIPMLSEHYQTECDKKEDRRKCHICGLILDVSQFQTHMTAKKCEALRPGEDTCQLCGAKIKDGEQGWRSHLRDSPGCPKSNRKPIRLLQKPQAPVRSPAPITVSNAASTILRNKLQSPLPQTRSPISQTSSVAPSPQTIFSQAPQVASPKLQIGPPSQPAVQQGMVAAQFVPMQGMAPPMMVTGPVSPQQGYFHPGIMGQVQGFVPPQMMPLQGFMTPEMMAQGVPPQMFMTPEMMMMQGIPQENFMMQQNMAMAPLDDRPPPKRKSFLNMFRKK